MSVFSTEKDPVLNRASYHAQEILKLYPSSSYHIFGLGRTSGLVMEYLRKSPKGEGRGYLTEAPVEKIKDILSLSKRDKERLFERVLPHLNELGERKIVLHRVLWRSHAMQGILADLVLYMKERGYPLPLTIYAVTHGDTSDLDLLKKDNLSADVRVNAVQDTLYNEALIDEIEERPKATLKEKSYTNRGLFHPMEAQRIIKKSKWKGFKKNDMSSMANPLAGSRDCLGELRKKLLN